MFNGTLMAYVSLTDFKMFYKKKQKNYNSDAGCGSEMKGLIGK